MVTLLREAGDLHFILLTLVISILVFWEDLRDQRVIRLIENSSSKITSNLTIGMGLTSWDLTVADGCIYLWHTALDSVAPIRCLELFAIISNPG